MSCLATHSMNSVGSKRCAGCGVPPPVMRTTTYRPRCTSMPSLIVLALTVLSTPGAACFRLWVWLVLLLFVLFTGGQVYWLFPHLTTPCYLSKKRCDGHVVEQRC